MGENLTFSVRKLLFQGILYKQIAWFDNKNRAPGILSSVLSEDITLLNGLSSELIAIILETVLCFIIGAILSLIYSWRVGLVCLGVSPFVLLGGIMMAKL